MSGAKKLCRVRVYVEANVPVDVRLTDCQFAKIACGRSPGPKVKRRIAVAVGHAYRLTPADATGMWEITQIGDHDADAHVPLW